MTIKKNEAVATAKGLKFEREVAALLKANGMRVTPNAKAAKPRQTDLFAKDVKLSLLVEVKNRKAKINSGDIDNVRVRLSRLPADVVGVIFTTSELIQDAIKQLKPKGMS